MSVCFVWDPTAWEHPLARWTVHTLASLLELRTRETRLGERVADDEALVFVGPEAAAPAEAAAVIAFDLWPEWDPDTLALADIAGVPLPCPRGEGGTCRIGFNAACIAAIADQAIRNNGHVANVTCHALAPAHNMAIDNYAAANSS